MQERAPTEKRYAILKLGMLSLSCSQWLNLDMGRLVAPDPNAKGTRTRCAKCLRHSRSRR